MKLSETASTPVTGSKKKLSSQHADKLLINKVDTHLRLEVRNGYSN